MSDFKCLRLNSMKIEVFAILSKYKGSALSPRVVIPLPDLKDHQDPYIADQFLGPDRYPNLFGSEEISTIDESGLVQSLKYALNITNSSDVQPYIWQGIGKNCTFVANGTATNKSPDLGSKTTCGTTFAGLSPVQKLQRAGIYAGNLTRSPWRATRNRQDITELLYINATINGFDWPRQDTTVFKVQANSSAAYFELPNYLNEGVAGPFLEKDPSSLCDEHCSSQGQVIWSVNSLCYSHLLTNFK